MIQTSINSILSAKLNKKKRSHDGENEDQDEDDKEMDENGEENELQQELKEISRWLLERLRVNINARPALVLKEMKERFNIDDSRNVEMKKKIGSTKAMVKSKAWKKIT